MIVTRKRNALRNRGGWLFPVAAAGWLLPSTRAQAHTTFPGLGEYASGFLHPLTTPLHLLVLLAMGLWLGQHAPLRIKEPAAVFAGAAAVGLGWAAARGGGVYPPLLAGIGLCAGACVAVDLQPPWWVKLIAGGIAALALGSDSGVETGTPGSSAIKIMSATWVSLVLCLVNIAFYVSLLPATRWAQIGVRVLGSWIVAITILLLAFALRR